MPEKIQWIKSIFSKNYFKLRVLKEENDFDYLRNKYNAKRSKTHVALLNQGFRFVVHLVSSPEHKTDQKAGAITAFWEKKGFKVFFLESFNDVDFYEVREEIKNHKKMMSKQIKMDIKKLEKTDT